MINAMPHAVLATLIASPHAIDRLWINSMLFQQIRPNGRTLHALAQSGIAEIIGIMLLGTLGGRQMKSINTMKLIFGAIIFSAFVFYHNGWSLDHYTEIQYALFFGSIISGAASIKLDPKPITTFVVFTSIIIGNFGIFESLFQTIYWDVFGFN